jgi:hypothetical protein
MRWLTTDRTPSHGVGGVERPLTDEERFAVLMTDGWMPPKGAVWPNKHAVRITVLIPRSDRKLHHWPAWGRKRLAPEWYATLDRSGGGKSKTWWIYFGTIPPSSFRAIDLLTSTTALEAV